MYDMSKEPLSRERVLRAALAVADDGGLHGLTIRSLAQRLGTKPMSLYHYVANKDEILDGLVDLVFTEIELPEPTGRWREEMAKRCPVGAAGARAGIPGRSGCSSRGRRPGPATLRHHDANLGALRAGGFSVAETGHAYAVLDAFVYGFAVQEASLPFEGPDGAAEVAGPIMALMEAGEYPHMVEFAVQHAMLPGYDFGDEFDFGLDLVLDGLARMLEG